MGLLMPAPRGMKYETNFSGRPSITWGAALTASATPHALSSTRTELVASLAHDTSLIRIRVHGLSASATLTDALLNIYIGAGGSEVLLIDSLQVGWANVLTAGEPTYYEFPVRIPRGSRLSCTLRALIASETAQVTIECFEHSDYGWVGAGVETLGQVTASSRGTAVTPGTSSDGAWTSIGTSTRRYRAITGVYMGNTDTSLAQGIVSLDIGSGSAALPGLENFDHIADSNERSFPMTFRPRVCDIPDGTALQARLQCSATDAEVKYVTLYGVY